VAKDVVGKGWCDLRSQLTAVVNRCPPSSLRVSVASHRGNRAALSGRKPMGILVWLLVGLIAGFLARFLVPGPDPMGILGTLVLGLVGSLIGGFLGALIFEGDIDVNAAGIVGSVIGAVIALLIYRAIGGRRTV
jgi:uncharacterized membrane protein YeaQ/YmgE (transglycosylase-associated protein family)